MEKKMIPFSLYLPVEHHQKLKEVAKDRKASALVRDAITMLVDGNDAFKAGYNKAIRDASKVVYDCEEAQMVAVKGRDLGAILTEQIQLLEMK
jgi:hypothetical protein